jgi:NAD(P)-dependent dehydrogenase (short-subunit alcohol dehydrogenase family)
MADPSASAAQSPLSGRHAVVTGGSRGIGLAIGRALVAHGAAVTLIGRGEDELSAASAACGSRCGYALADVRDEASVATAFARARAERGAIAILVNNAGSAASAPFTATGPALWREMLAVNLDGTYHATRAALPEMLAARSGRIVNVASTAGLVGYAYVAAYCAAKHAVVGLTRALAVEVARQGITVNAVCPGYADTELTGRTIANIVARTGMSAADAAAALVERSPLRRLVTPAEVADAVAWLCLPGSAAINGQAISVSGGEVMTG